MLSVVIPAHDEEELIGRTLKSVREAAAGAGIEPCEVLVVDDASTDRTAEWARAAGATVVASGRRSIGATRNIGARAARHPLLLFCDADTVVSATNLCEMRAAVAAGAIGGGAPMRWDRPVPLSGRLPLACWNAFSRLTRSPAGAFFFVTRAAFDRAGGFDERYLVSEELWLGRALRRLGRLVILRSPLVTSARKIEKYTTWELVRQFARIALRPWRAPHDRRALDLWYDRRR